MVSRLLQRLRSRLPWRRQFRVIAIVDAADEVPARLPARGAVLVGNSEQPSWVAFDCPCADHHRVMLNLDRTRRPAWDIIATSPLTIHPSIDAWQVKKRCHYFIRDGRVQWARDQADHSRRRGRTR